MQGIQTGNCLNPFWLFWNACTLWKVILKVKECGRNLSLKKEESMPVDFGKILYNKEKKWQK